MTEAQSKNAFWQRIEHVLTIFKNDDDIEDGYTDYYDIPDPNIENFPEEKDFFDEEIKIRNRIKQATSGNGKKIKINSTQKNILEDKTINNEAKKRRKQNQKKTNEKEIEEK